MTALLCGSVLPLVAQQPKGDTTQAQPRRVPSGGQLSFDFSNTDIRAVIGAIAEAGGINYIANDVSGKQISLHVRRPDGRASALALLQAVVRANGLYMTEHDGLYMISSLPPLTDTSITGIPITIPDTELFVYQLKHANATQLAQVLQAIFNGSALPAGAGALARQTLSQSLSRTGQGQTRFGGGGGFGGGGFGGGVGGGVVTGGAGQGNQGGNQGAQGGGGPGGAGPPRPRMIIVPENSTNALLVRTDSVDWLRVKQAIEAVDLRPRQVLIEVMIAEVQRNDNLNVGISAKASNQRTFKGRSLGSASLPLDTTANPNNFIFDFTRYGAVDINVVLAALKSRGDVRILSRPLVFAENNVESYLLVGSQQPFIQSFQTFATGAAAQNQIVQYQAVGTSLAILPTINPDGYVNLQVQQEMSAATDQIQFGAPVISTREASASLFVKDGQTIVVGGLADTQEQRTRTGIPLLSDIPVIGGLFGSTRKTSARTELFLFLTPHIVEADSDVSRILDAVHKKAGLLHDVPVTPYVVPGDPGPGARTAPAPTPGTPAVPPHGTSPVETIPLSKPQ